MADTVLCADIGTSSLKAALITCSGSVIASSRQVFADSASDHVSTAWMQAMQQVCAGFGSNLKNVTALCISGNGPTIVSENGTTLLWNILTDEFYPTASLFIPRILSFKKLYRSIWDSESRLFSGPEYLIWSLTGNAVTILPEERFSSAYWTAKDLSRFLIPENKLPPFVPPAYDAGPLTKEKAALLGLQNQVHVFCGAPDFIAALIGTNTLKNGMLCDRAGSSEGLNMCSYVPVYGRGIRTLPSILPDLWNAGVLLIESGKLFSDYKKQIEQSGQKDISYQSLAALSVSDPLSGGYKLMKSLADEVSQGLHILLEAADKNGIAVSPYMAITGGQAKIPEWLQMKADIIKYPLAVMNSEDAELTGDAVLAWAGLGSYPSVKKAADAMVTVKKIYSPKK